MRAGNTAKTVRARIESSGERVWRLADFDGMPFTAVAQTLSRLARQGAIQRLGKGLYYRPRQTAFGPSRPNIARIRSLAAGQQGSLPGWHRGSQPAGFHDPESGPDRAGDRRHQPAAADSRQGGARPHAAAGGVADTVRDGCRPSRLPSQPRGIERAVPEETVEKLLQYFREPGTLRAHSQGRPVGAPARPRHAREPSASRLDQPEDVLAGLRKSLNPLSRFDFGILAALAYARQWQAKERRDHETV